MEDQTSAQQKIYGPLTTVAITVGIYFASQIVAVLIASLLPLVLHWTKAQTISWLQNNVWGTFVFVAVIEAITLYLLHLFLSRKKANFRSLGLDRFKAAHIAYALSGFAAYFVLYIVGLIVVKQLFPGINLEQKQELGFNTSTTGSALLPVFVSLVILPPVTEEIVVRGFLFGGLRSKFPFFASAAIASALFAAAHLGEGGSGGLLWVAAVDTFILSLVLCYLREKSGSLWPSIVVHMLKNGLAFVILFNVFQYVR